MEIWILFSVANDYNQPDRAFEKLYWEKPTAEKLASEIGYIKEIGEKLLNGEHYDGYWLEEFVKS